MRNNPIKQLSEQDLNRKEIKLQKIKDQMNPEHEAYRPGAQKKLAEKLHKTQHQVDTGRRGRPTSLRNEAWLAGTSRKSALNMLGVSSSPLNDNGDDDLNTFLSNVEPIDNPEYYSYTKKLNPDSEVFGKYSPDSEAHRSIEHDYFIKRRNEESDATARQAMGLQAEFDAAHEARDFGVKNEIMAKQKKIRDKIKFNVDTYSASEYLDKKMNDKRFQK